MLVSKVHGPCWLKHLKVLFLYIRILKNDNNFEVVPQICKSVHLKRNDLNCNHYLTIVIHQSPQVAGVNSMHVYYKNNNILWLLQYYFLSKNCPAGKKGNITSYIIIVFVYRIHYRIYFKFDLDLMNCVTQSKYGEGAPEAVRVLSELES